MNTNFAEVNGWTIWYERYGSGPLPLLLIPGSLGTSKTDYLKQVEGVHALDHEQFTIIGVEAPGWGRNRPPERPYKSNVYDNDCECFYQLMTGLGYERFYVLAWSDGAITSMWLACKHPDAIIKMAFHGIPIRLTHDMSVAFEATRDVNVWGNEKLDKYLRVYDSKETIQTLWNRHLTYFFENLYSFYHTFYEMVSKEKDKIQFPMLVIHGEKDFLSAIENPQYILTQVKHAELYRFPNGQHDLHQRDAASYKKLVEEFFLRRV